ncbi:protein of unknown function [Tangfeifania diversioriginum]|uniref:3-keto-alpha-glucoside-1,2-lyase/3-keto-2-hydroxy-glucal hydratase domain-containing protein n=1 Tax=Tangfeifania diversioriginum TaxID=1168035 RepID=A0A1M6FVK9_9BACT|nr:DUF1080 domain-containing protein [Tangfeifania diversioriginum]SHJ01745.1 protein of unknown function [Tangfeifania diversioriginum]
MKKLSVLIVALILATGFSNAQKPDGFYGMWNIEIEGGSVGWLHVFENKCFLDARLLWQGGSVLPVQHVSVIDGNHLMVMRAGELSLDGENGERKMIQPHYLKITRSGDRISGVSMQAARNGMGTHKMKFYGWKSPGVPSKPNLSDATYGNPVELFNGKNLDGWKLLNPNQVNGFKVENGVLVNDPVQKEGEHIWYGNLRTEQEFEDFNLTLEVNIPEGSNSGVYLRGMYEVQVVDSYGKEVDSHNMGALYSRITPSEAAEKPAGEWQTMDITLYKRHLTVKLNGTTIIDNQPVYGPTGGAISADLYSPGPIYLQGDHGKVLYRNLVLTPIVE